MSMVLGVLVFVVGSITHARTVDGQRLGVRRSGGLWRLKTPAQMSSHSLSFRSGIVKIRLRAEGQDRGSYVNQNINPPMPATVRGPLGDSLRHCEIERCTCCRSSRPDSPLSRKEEGTVSVYRESAFESSNERMSRRNALIKAVATGAVGVYSWAQWQQQLKGSSSMVESPKSCFAYCMATRMESYEKLVHQRKEQLFRQLFDIDGGTGVVRGPVDIDGDTGVVRGAVDIDGGTRVIKGPKGATKLLEVGVGAGPNMKMYSSIGGGMLSVTGVDVNPYMEQYATKAAQENGVLFNFVVGDASRLPFPDASFDRVVASHTLCSVPNPTKMVSEIARVLKPGGKYLFWEHVRAWDDRPGLRFQQELFNPLQKAVFQGCHLNRDSLGTIEKCIGPDGFESVDSSNLYLGDRPLLSPHAIGIATRSQTRKV
ncbi:hypothetical protein AAMO2058_001189200 [Amorphochlora amoebiformis]